MESIENKGSYNLHFLIRNKPLSGYKIFVPVPQIFDTKKLKATSWGKCMYHG